jgi:hypothetical protein
MRSKKSWASKVFCDRKERKKTHASQPKIAESTQDNATASLVHELRVFIQAAAARRPIGCRKNALGTC